MQHNRCAASSSRFCGPATISQCTPTADARALCRAALFGGAAVPVLARFSDFPGIPDVPNTAPGASPHGLALQFRPADGPEADVVTHSFNGFPVANSDEFGELFRAIAASANAPAPTPLDRFLETHPIAKTFLSTQKPPPVSFATLTYFGVNSFRFLDTEGRAKPVRYRLVPEAGEHFLDAKALESKGPDYLSDEIAAHVAGAPVRFDWLAQVARPGDVVDDPSVAWPESRQLVRLGTVELLRVADDQEKLDKASLFLPGRVPPGIQTADPMLEMRDGAYAVSFGQRQ